MVENIAKNISRMDCIHAKEKLITIAKYHVEFENAVRKKDSSYHKFISVSAIFFLGIGILQMFILKVISSNREKME